MIALLLATFQTFPYPNGSQGYADPQATIEKICTPNYTSTIRPPVSYTNKLKKKQMADLGLSGKPSDYEEDHIISLELGGHPTDPRNLSPEPYLPKPGAREKDQVEDHLHRCVCKGKIDLILAQKIVSEHWQNAYAQIQKGIECPGL